MSATECSPLVCVSYNNKMFLLTVESAKIALLLVTVTSTDLTETLALFTMSIHLCE